MSFHLPRKVDIVIMKIMQRSILIIAVLCGPLAASVVAQEPYKVISPEAARTLSNSEWERTLELIRSDTKSLLDDNEKLNTEYTFLKEKLSNLRDAIEQLKEEIAIQERENDRLRGSHHEEMKASGSIKKKIERVQEEMATIESKNEDLSQQLAKAEEESRLWELKVSNLEAQKRELTLDLKLQEFTREEIEMEEDDEVKELKRQLRSLQTKEDEMGRTLSGLRDDVQATPVELERIKSENRDLTMKTAAVNRQIREQERMNQRLKRENVALAKSAPLVPNQLVKERRTLQSEVARLEKQLESIRKSVASSAATIEKKRSLMNQVMSMDASNQDLREQITAMMQEIADLKSEINTLESR